MFGTDYGKINITVYAGIEQLCNVRGYFMYTRV